METDSNHEREVRAARNQSLFRSINEKMRQLNEATASIVGSFTIACECADTNCIEMIDIAPEDYRAARSEPRHFVVLAEHVLTDIETVVAEGERYVVVEKFEIAGVVAESLRPSPTPSG